MEVADTTIGMQNTESKTNTETSRSINSGSSNTTSSPEEQNINTSTYQNNNSQNGVEVEEVDLSLDSSETGADTVSGTSSAVSTEEKKGNWLTRAASAIYDTGAKVATGVKSFVVEGLASIGKTIAETASNFASNVKTIVSAFAEAAKSGPAAFLATGAVFVTSVRSGIGKFRETLYDGVAWIGGKMISGASWGVGSLVGLINEDAGNAIKDAGAFANKKIKEFIAIDLVGEFNKWFYEETPFGQWINENSNIKYDSEIAKTLQAASRKTMEYAAMATLYAFTGGGGAAALGFLYGTGKAAESTYQRNGTDTSKLQELGIFGSGILTAASWAATGKLMNGFIDIGKDVMAEGAKKVFSQFASDVLTKDFWIKAFKDGVKGVNGVSNAISSALMTADSLTPYITGEEEITVDAVTKIFLTFAANMGLNILEDAFRGYVNDYSLKKAERAFDSFKDMLDDNSIDPEKKGQIIRDFIDTHPEVRGKIVEELREDIKNSLGKALNIEDDETINRMADCILGKTFMKEGSNAKADYDELQRIIEPYLTDKTKGNFGYFLWSHVDSAGVRSEVPYTLNQFLLGNEDMPGYIESVNKYLNADEYRSFWDKLSKTYIEAVKKNWDPKEPFNVILSRMDADHLIDEKSTFARTELFEILKDDIIKELQIIEVASKDNLDPTKSRYIDLTTVKEIFNKILKETGDEKTAVHAAIKEIERIFNSK